VTRGCRTAALTRLSLSRLPGAATDCARLNPVPIVPAWTNLPARYRETAQQARDCHAAGRTETVLEFINSYARLPSRFYARLAPTKVADPRLIRMNAPLAAELGVDLQWLRSAEGIEFLAGNHVPAEAEPIAMAYAGHQFGHWVPQLGDGRAILLGEIRGHDGLLRDVQLKGSGPTPYSRNGDGRAALGPVLREYIVSEAMHALGIPTTRSLAAVATGEWVLRQEGMLPGAVLTRVSTSHTRVGSFEYFANRDDVDGVRALADYVIARLYPEAQAAAQPYLELLKAVIARTAKLIASWQLVGFIHGVMNTDNTSIAGETIDYGPCAFMDAYHPGQVFSSIDHQGRYAYANQPRIAHWNLTRFAESLLPLLGADADAAVRVAKQALDNYRPLFEAAWAEGFRAKLGFVEQRDGDLALIAELLERMAEGQADFTLTFRRLCDSAECDDKGLLALFNEPAAIDSWLAKWRDRLAHEEVAPGQRAAAMRAVSPAIIPRNHRIEAAISAAQAGGDFTPFERLLAVLADPYGDQLLAAEYGKPPRPEEVVPRTFCGT
jgi:uncharacterized protein YdiU (UPF0061 family)